jgi:hypothetical protein
VGTDPSRESRLRPSALAEALAPAPSKPSQERRRRDVPWPALERGGALLGIAALVCAAWLSWWPFNAHPQPVQAYRRPSIWQLLLSDRLTLGFARALILGLSVYVAGSVVALMVARRWLRGAGGLSADDAESASRIVKALEGANEDLTNQLARATAQIGRLTRERDQARRSLESIYQRIRRAARTTTTTRPASSPIVEPRENDERRRDPGDQENPR